MTISTIDRLNGVNDGVAIKVPVRVVAQTPITLAGLQTIDGVALVEGHRVLVAAQANSVDNGIYEASTGDWKRTKDFDGARDIVDGTLVLAQQPTALIWRTSFPQGGVIGTDAITFTPAPTFLPSGTILANDGTAAAPSYSFAADTNTGLRRPHNDAISIVTNGVDRMWGDSNGRIVQGLGVTAGESGTLAATGISNANRPNFQSHVSNSNNGGIASYQWNDSGAAAWMHFLKSRGSVIGTHTAVQNNDSIGWMRFGGSDGTQFIEGARFIVITDDTIGTGDVPMGYRWFTKAAGASLNEKMRLTSSGNLAIGTTSPNANAIFQVATTVRQSIPAPVMTTTQKNALTPVNGGMVYDNTLKSLEVYNGTAWENVGKQTSSKFAHHETANTAGGSSTSGSFITRPINTTIYNDIADVSLASNEITLPVGTYYITAWSMCGHANNNNAVSTCRIQNITDGTTIATGSSTALVTANNINGVSRVDRVKFTVASGTKNIALQYRVGTSLTTNGLGFAVNLGQTECYAEITIEKI